MKPNLIQVVWALIVSIMVSGVVSGCAGVSLPSVYPVKGASSLAYSGSSGLPLIYSGDSNSLFKYYSTTEWLHEKTLFDEKQVFAISYHFWQRANESETIDNWYMARYFCRIASQLDPENQEIISKIAILTEKINIESEAYFKCGLDLFQNNEIESARDAFVKTLEINPEHEGAKEYLFEILQEPEQKKYQVTEIKSLDTIAQEVYEDPEKSFLIAYFNDLPDGTIPKFGSTLILPPLSIAKPTPGFNLEENLAKARSYLESRQFSRALQTVSKIQIHVPECPEAVEIEQNVYRLIAQEFEKFGKYSEALNVMLQVDADCPSTQEYITHLKQLVKDRADMYYRRGVRYFVNEEIEKAIKEWKKALAIDPTNTTTQKDIENAENLLEKLRQIQ